MKTLALFAISALLAGTLSAPLAGDAHAQNDPDILKRIAQEAETQIESQIGETYGSYDAAPPEIRERFELGHEQVVLLGEALESSDVEEARGHFLSAMKHFKEITRVIAAPAAQTEDRDLLSELNRLANYVDSLKRVSDTHNTGIDFEGIDSLIDQARSEISGGTGDPAATIDQVKSLIRDIKNNLREHASQSASDRARQFVEEQLDGIDQRLARALDAGADPSQLEEARGLVEEIRTMMERNETEDAKQILRELIGLIKQIERSVR